MMYIITAFLLILLYICAIFCMPYMRSTKFWNLAFTVSIFALYLNVVLKVYFDVGLYDWNFQNTLPVANVSPFMFASVLVIHIFPSKVKKHFYLLISLLSVGMLLSPLLGCIYNAAINYKFHLHFLCDFLAHILLSLWGVYLIKSKQVEPKVKSSVISASIIIGAAFVMLVLNLIFDTAFFGLSLYGKHNIYNNVLTENSYLSAILYFTGLTAVLLMGFVYSRLLLREKKVKRI